jgi:hypothetical protein
VRVIFLRVFVVVVVVVVVFGCSDLDPSDYLILEVYQDNFSPVFLGQATVAHLQTIQPHDEVIGNKIKIFFQYVNSTSNRKRKRERERKRKRNYLG